MDCLYIADYVLASDIPKIKEMFETLNLGSIKYIELIDQPECEYQADKDIYSAALVYIDYWNNSSDAENFKNKILHPTLGSDGAKIYYNNNEDYWLFELPTFNVNYELIKLKEQISTLNNRLNNTDYYMNYNTNGVQYLLHLDRVNIFKKTRKEKAEERYKKNRIAQRKWQQRLRPKNVLRSVN